jgi:hypothetical protein
MRDEKGLSFNFEDEGYFRSVDFYWQVVLARPANKNQQFYNPDHCIPLFPAPLFCH